MPRLVTLQFTVENDDADSVSCALDAIADEIANAGYTDGEVDRTKLDAHGKRHSFCVWQPRASDMLGQRK